MKSRRGAGPWITKPYTFTIVVLLILPLSLTQQTDEHYNVEPTPALRIADDVLTTVLLVSNDNRTEAHGRFLNVRPAVGLLTSTARTFIQEGVTTEYATQVLGTTLDNGRLYAQLLKKSSRVLYDKDNFITPSLIHGGVVHTSIVGETPLHQAFVPQKILLQSHNDLVADKDWQDVDDKFILEKNSFVGNTDYIGSISRPTHVFPIKIESENNKNSLEIEESKSLKKNLSSVESLYTTDAFRIKAHKVQPAIDLPTFTVKNVFSPSGFSWESSHSDDNNQKNVNTNTETSASEQRSPKLLYHQVMKEEYRPFSTVTYYGFADFTTIVGDSVIVFSPSTSSAKPPPGYVTSIKGEATLGRQPESFVSNVAITITQDLIEPTFVAPMLSTDVNDLHVTPKDMRVISKPDIVQSGFQIPRETEIKFIVATTTPQQQLSSVEPTDIEQITKSQDNYNDIEKTDSSSSIKEETAPTAKPPSKKNEIVFTTESENDDEDVALASSMSDVSSSVSTSTTDLFDLQTTSRVMLSRPSNEEILQIYSSLASVEAAKKANQISETNTGTTSNEFTTESIENVESLNATTENPSSVVIKLQETVIQPDIQTQGGATTIFFEDDPFLEFVSPSSTATIEIKQTLQQSDELLSPISDIKSEIENETDIESHTEEAIYTTEDEIESTTKIDTTEEPDSETETTTILSENIFTSNESKVDGKTEPDQESERSDTAKLYDTETYYKPIVKEIKESEEVENCIRTSQVFLTQIPKTVSLYTTFFIPNDKESGQTLTSVETNIVPSFDISEATKHYCIQPTSSVNLEYTKEIAVLERPSKAEQSIVVDLNVDEENSGDHFSEITTPIDATQPIDGDTSDLNYDDEEEGDEEDDDDEQESGEEIELIYKTLYTTYTYLTTFFHDLTTSVSSRKEVVTNIITSSLGVDSSSLSTEAEIESTGSINPINKITPTVSVGIGRPTVKFVVESEDLIKIDGILREDSISPTAQLDDTKIAKTYYTTYTYYTTIFVDGETEVMSRTEVHTNVVGPPTDNRPSHSARNLEIDESLFNEDNAVIDIRPTATYNPIQRTSIPLSDIKNETVNHNTLSNRGLKELESSSSSSSSRTEKKIVAIGDDFLKIKTNVRPSSLISDHQAIDNGVLDDQISSESNRDEIVPSATLLLQTSFTTFTYYTTMYSNEATNIISRLETVTNVVTETLQPTKALSIDEATLPITYFTTFTYWTKLSKDGEITTLSREETVSNVVIPTLTEPSMSYPTYKQPSSSLSFEPNTSEPAIAIEEIETTSIRFEPTTYYTTYTYYTTSYVGDQTITDSRYETITNVVTPSSTFILPSQNANTSKSIDSLQKSVFDVPSKLDSQRTVSYDYKTIVDAESISTLFFKTVVIDTTIGGTQTMIASSTSSIAIDEIKKALLPTTVTENNESTRSYKTGLVRLIDGTKLLNHTTTIYQSKVIGTIIDQRYAQIIESTSSFIIEKTPVIVSVPEISATKTLLPTLVQPTAFIEATSDKPIESSISDIDESDQSREQEEDEDGSDEEDENDRRRTRLSFQTKKKTFTPVIRPFASRNRPQFAPKRKNILPSSATIITRSDFTPTITATPALKLETRGRFSSSRKANIGISSSGISFSSSQGGKRFGRPNKSSQFGGLSSSSSFPGSSRNRLQSSRIQGSSSSFGSFSTSRRSGGPFRGSATNSRTLSSSYSGNSRLRIRPSNFLPYDQSASTISYTTLPPESEEEGVTQKYDSEEETEVTTENLRRNNNPLLRFRRPQVSRTPFQPSQRNSAGNLPTARRVLPQKPKAAEPTTTTLRPKPRAFQRPLISQIQNRSRPQNNLFPPRRLFQQQNVNQAIDEDQKSGDDFSDIGSEENDSAEYENDGEGVEENEQEDANRRRRESLSRLLGKTRSKRQADYNARSNFRNRFRRPTTPKLVTDDRVEDSVDGELSTVRSRTTPRFNPRSHSLGTSTHSSSKSQPNSRAIRPTKPNSSNRAQFTLREKDTTPKVSSRPSSNFRRPIPNGVSSRRTTTTASRPKAPRLKTYGNSVTESSHSSPRGRSSTSRTRSTTRGRSRNDITTDPIIPIFDGTITVTHTTPTEITIPIVNGKVTEYKNIVTTTTSTEVLLPNQYTSLIGQNGASTLVLTKEDSSVNPNGATEITQFILLESPTTTVIFTPTTIRGRKTSFAHAIPSTVYQVENVVSTMQAQLAANAPLANILLSQLLLGNIGLNQPNINPLLALGATQPTQAPGIPTTEFKTRSSTYVTTVTNAMSTVIPLTFHGKEVLTTIFDSSSNVITATEYFTDTIVVTPTVPAQAQQVNSLLLPLLLQQQLQGQSNTQPVLPIQHSIVTQNLLSDNLQDIDSNGIQKYNDYNQDIDDYSNSPEELVQPLHKPHSSPKSGGRKGGRKSNKQQTVNPVVESTVITLYVSGRRPGEFSTVLSTVQLGPESSLHKRQVNNAQPLLKSDSPDYNDFYKSDGSEIQEYLLPATSDIISSHNNFLSEETQSLESIVGDVGLWYSKTSAQIENLTSQGRSTIYRPLESRSKSVINTNRHQAQQNTHNLNAMFDSQHQKRSINFSPISKSESIDNGRFFHIGSFNIDSPIKSEETLSNENNLTDERDSADEARFNLATRVMSNGVEVIIAGDKNTKGPHKPSALRILPSLPNKPMTLAPSTLKDQMILVIPSNVQENYTIPINSNHFITKTCLTTYTYRTTYLQNGTTTVESREKVVSNTATEERNYLKINPTESLGVTLSKTPELAVGIFHTTYTYYNTILDGDLPLVLSSQHVLTNTVTGPNDYISFLQPSEAATPVLETNTFFSKISLTKTLKESDIEKIVSTSNILTQVIVTESLPPRNTAVMTSYIAFDTQESNKQKHDFGNETTNSNTKFITYTYYNEKNNDNKSTNIQTNDFKINFHEKLYLYMKKNTSRVPSIEKTSDLTMSPSKLHGSFHTDMHIYATKTYLTTFTYFTTLVNTNRDPVSSTVVNFHTRVIENVITESIPSFMMGTDLLSKFETKLQNPKNHNSYVTMVTLAGGHSLEITAMNMLHPSPTVSKTTNKKESNTTKIVSGKLESNVILPTTSLTSITSSKFENSNEVIDSDTASSENDDQYVSAHSETIFLKNNTKTTDTTVFPSVNQIIGSLNFNRLQALGPVFNAMAGLIQNNFGTSYSSDSKKNTSAINIESKHAIKNISAYDIQAHEGPIYIPVQTLQGEIQYRNPEITGHITPQSLHISPPETEWYFDEKQNRGTLQVSAGKPTYETPLLNGGIPISPGEVITANSDVIIGKPNGIKPLIPFNDDSSKALVPPPLHSPFPFQLQHMQHPKHTKAIPRPIPLETTYEKQVSFDGILKPPPLQPPTMHHQIQNTNKIVPNRVLQQNYRMHYATGYMQQPLHVPQKHQPILVQQITQHGTHLQNQAHRIGAKRPETYNPHWISSLKPNYIPYAPHDYDQPHMTSDTKNGVDQKQELYNNEILEIKRIPEVYSTELPGSVLESAIINTNYRSRTFTTVIKKVINSDKPMLVDIKPSQITNVVIPRDNLASILIVESAVELHKNGQYYNEPTTYSDSIITGNIAHSTPARKPILSNQQVNLDTNVLSHNVDINVPPITFNKDTDFPQSTPVRGQIQKEVQSSFQMPHITIPLTDNQIQVNLTPHNTITQEVSGTFVGNVDELKASDNYVGETLKNLEPPRYANSNSKKKKHEVFFEASSDINKSRPNTILPELWLESGKHSYQSNNMYHPISKLDGTSPTFFLSQLTKPTRPGLQMLSLEGAHDTPSITSSPNIISSTQSTEKSKTQKDWYNDFFSNTTSSQKDSYSQVRPALILQNDEEKDLLTDFSEGLPANRGGMYWQSSSQNGDDEDDPTENSNKIEDQKVSSSVNIVIPAHGQLTKEKQKDDSKQLHSSSKPQNRIQYATSSPKFTQSMISTQNQKYTLKSRTTPMPKFTPVTQLDYKTSIIGTESFLDPASVNAVNNMSELDEQIVLPSSPVASSTNITKEAQIVLPGKPFTQTKPSTKPQQKANNKQDIYLISGDGFKMNHEKENNHSIPNQFSFSIDDLKKSSSTQTEAPFNPKYTKRTKKPPTHNESSTTLHQFSTEKNASKVDNFHRSNTNFSTYHVKESVELFDFHDSMYPHISDFVHVPTGKTTTITEVPGTSVIDTTRPKQTVIRPFIAEPSLNMKPPPVSILLHSATVMGLSPPPLPSSTISILSMAVATSQPPLKDTKSKNANYRLTNYSHSLHTTTRPMKRPLFPTKVFHIPRVDSSSPSKTELTTLLQTSTTSTLMRRKPSPLSRTPSTPKYVPEIIKLNVSDYFLSIYNESKSPPYKTIPVIKVGQVSLEEMQNASNSKTKPNVSNIAKKEGSYDTLMYTLSQKIPDDILYIEGSEVDAYRTPTTAPFFENKTTQSQSKNSLTRIDSSSRITNQIIIPTKYITNTHVLTVTSTKISVVTSLGIQSTQTLTLTKTKTSTLIDTVTETHTLLSPTKVIANILTTQGLETDLYSSTIKPSVETVDRNFINKGPASYSVPTKKLNVRPIVSNLTKNLENNSIFVVMTDKKSHGGTFSINPSMIDTPQNINAIGSTNDEDNNAITLDYDENIAFDLPTRDEEAETNEVNHVLLGGVLIATPPKSSDSTISNVTSKSCKPSCKASRNELCQNIDNRKLCVCRPGFARMFPDRPCRPTYTYAMEIPIHRVSKETLHFKEQYRVKDSEDFKQLASITHNAVDRMIMQSDLRDVYHGVHVTSFDPTDSENGILGKFLIQLSDNNDENRLADVIKKYLRQNNFSIGGTEIFTTRNGVHSLEINDFNECASNQFHDCSENSRCFNLQGTYTCSCQEGYADLSENSIYPGRICSAEIIGCEKCHYHGKCVQIDTQYPSVCECFHWYTGASCQLNLKILLIALIAVGTILFILLLFCVLLTCTKRRKKNNIHSLISGMHIVAPKNSRLSIKSITTDKKAMIKDSSSETSQNSLPFALKDSKKQSTIRAKNFSQQKPINKNINQRGYSSPTVLSPPPEVDHRHYSEQSDRSLTVMIPRAKYHHSVTQSTSHVDNIEHITDGQLKSISGEVGSKASTVFHSNAEKIPSKNTLQCNSNHGALHTTSTGALVSAGFEVSATVGNIVSQQVTTSPSYENRNNQIPRLINDLHSRKTNYSNPQQKYNSYKGEKYIDSMDVWLDTIQQNELTAEARSFDETTIQAPTKSIRSAYERHVTQSNGNDEANTMAERDIGSTFLLPHTHLYKPDRDSDISGFDSF